MNDTALKNAEMFLSVTPIDKKKLVRLIESFIVFQEKIMEEGIISEVVLNTGINLYVPFDSPELLRIPEEQMRTILTSLGVRMLKLANVEGSTELRSINRAKKNIDSYSHNGFIVRRYIVNCVVANNQYFN